MQPHVCRGERICSGVSDFFFFLHIGGFLGFILILIFLTKRSAENGVMCFQLNPTQPSSTVANEVYTKASSVICSLTSGLHGSCLGAWTLAQLGLFCVITGTSSTCDFAPSSSALSLQPAAFPSSPWIYMKHSTCGLLQ